VFTARYALGPYIKQVRFVFKGLMIVCTEMKLVEYDLILVADERCERFAFGASTLIMFREINLSFTCEE
jgi:hypothetical protein